MMVISSLLKLYMYIVIIDAILSYFPQLQRQPWRIYLKRAADYSCDPVRKKMPPNLPIDFSPLVVVFAIELFIFLW